MNMTYPPASAANSYVKNRLLLNCRECECCGEQTHFNATHRTGFSVQTNVGGRVMAVRKAMFMACFPAKQIPDGARITSKCSNPNCINPKLLHTATPGQVLSSHYTKGIRDKREAAAHLARTKRAKAKLDAAAVQRIRMDDRKGTEAASEYGITPEHYNAIQRGEARRATANPFAALFT